MQEHNNISEVILQDKNIKTGKINDWRGKKEINLILANSYKRLHNISKAVRVENCGTELEFVKADNAIKLHKANFCKVRLCPLCAWRRSLKIFGQVSKIMDEMQNYNFIFLTLTVKNTSADNLNNLLDALRIGFNKLTKYKDFKNVVVGYFRALEITHNKDANTFHPHFHCILAVKSTYFNSKYYITQSKWVDMWHNALDVDYLPSVDVRKVKSGKNIKKAVAEVSKYAVKQTEYVSDNERYTDYIVSVYDNVLSNRRLVGFGGIMKDIHKRLNLDDTENGNLINTSDDETLRIDVAEIIFKYRWCVGFAGYNYYLIKD